MAVRRTKKVKPETLLGNRLASYLKIHHPDVIFRYDLHADMKLSIGVAKRNKQLHGKWTRGYPDLFIAQPYFNRKGKMKYGGLYLELKAGKSIPDNEHTKTQARFHAELRVRGYRCMFCLNFEDCVNKIKEYLKV